MKNLTTVSIEQKLSKLQKSLKQEFNIIDYLNLQTSVYSAFGTDKGEIAFNLLKSLDLEKACIISKSAFVKYYVWRGENGYGNYGTPQKQYKAEYDEMVEDEKWLELTQINFYYLEDKFAKKVQTAVVKKLGINETALYILKSTIQAHNNPYDRSLSFRKFTTSRLTKLWDNKSDIYCLFERDSLRNESNKTLLNWLNTI